MPRIRMLRPEHRQHAVVGPLSDREYRLWVGMLCEADDYGRLQCQAAQLRVLIWGYHPAVTVKQVEAAIQTLDKAGLVMLYDVHGTRYAVFPSWGHHQSPKYPSKPKLPPPPGYPENSTKYPPGLGEGSPVGSSSNGVVVGLDRTGLDRTGLNRTGLGSEKPGSKSSLSTSTGDFNSRVEALRASNPHLSLEEATSRALKETQDLVRATR